MPQNGILRLRLVFRSGVIIVGRAQVAKVDAQRDVKYKGVVTFIAKVSVGPIGNTINHPDVKLAFLLRLPGRILLITITFILQFQAQRSSGRLVLHAAKRWDRAVEHPTVVDRPRLFVAVVTMAVFIAG